MSGRFDPFEAPLVAGRLVRRYKRFLADIELTDGPDAGAQILAHCPNSGSMMGMAEPGSPVWVRPVDDPKRKLKWTWELVSADDGASWIGVNTMRPNHIVEWALRQGALPGIPADAAVRREVPYGSGSRVDLVAEWTADGTDERVWIEVKNTTLAFTADRRAADPTTDRRPFVAVFPDAVTTRGAKHMRELADVCAADDADRSLLVLLVNRPDCDRFDVAREIDSAYDRAFEAAEAAGVEIVALAVEPSPAGWRIRGPLPRA